MSLNVIYGPPGTGKTTSLLNIVDVALSNKIASSKIAYIAFTRKAAYEAKSRAMERFNLSNEDLPWFRTLHSFAFNQLALSRANIMTFNDYLKICHILGLHITKSTDFEEGIFTWQTRGDRLFFMEAMARAEGISLREKWESLPNEDLYWFELERLERTLNKYKQSTGKLDFIDIICKYIEIGKVPPIDVLIVDEAQDLTALQWKMVHKLISTAKESYVAGDDDQAIFRWAGADVDHFIDLSANKQVLRQSFRVPIKIQKIADMVTKHITKRIPKEWEPRPEEGEVNHVASIDEIDMSQGTWLLLARNLFLLDNYIQHCFREGFIFDAPYASPVKGEVFKAVKHWEDLREGKKIQVKDAINVYSMMSVKVGVAYGFKVALEKEPLNKFIDMDELRSKFGLLTTTPWHTALDKMDPLEIEYFMAALNRGEKLLDEPRIKICTIHGAKGGEADNVVLQLDMAERTFQEYYENPDDEHRVWYVGITRAKKKLFLVQPKSNRSYHIVTDVTPL